MWGKRLEAGKAWEGFERWKGKGRALTSYLFA